MDGKINWCSLMQNGKLPSARFFKIAMAGFGKYLKPFLRCPIKSQEVKFDRLIPDSKLMIFLPNSKFRLNLLLEGETADKQKDHLNFTFTATIVDS